MFRAKMVIITAIALTVIAVIALVFAAPSIQRSLFYPKPKVLPPVVGHSTKVLLTRLQLVLETNAPSVAAALQPGLSDAEITSLETSGGFRLSDDLRTLYRWHNGIARSNTVGLLPGQRFVPLDEIVSERAIISQQVSTATKLQKLAFAVFAEHRRTWIQIFDDGAGDGYFFDPNRSESEGAFFFHFAESGYYLWFPSIRNFLSGVAECYESHFIKVATDTKGLDEDYKETQKVWERLGKVSEDGE